MLGIVSGSLNGLNCGGDLPDYYTYVGHRQILAWVAKTVEEAKNPLSKFDFIDDNTIDVRCKYDEDCPEENCFEGLCTGRSTASSTRRRMKPNPDCPIDNPCKGRRERECGPAKCNRYGDSCWCETRRRTGRQAPDVVEDVQTRENTEFDFVEGEPDEWEIACAVDDDCPHRWYCFEEVSQSIFSMVFF